MLFCSNVCPRIRNFSWMKKLIFYWVKLARLDLMVILLCYSWFFHNLIFPHFILMVCFYFCSKSGDNSTSSLGDVVTGPRRPTPPASGKASLSQRQWLSLFFYFHPRWKVLHLSLLRMKKVWSIRKTWLFMGDVRHSAKWDSMGILCSNIPYIYISPSAQKPLSSSICISNVY